MLFYLQSFFANRDIWIDDIIIRLNATDVKTFRCIIFLGGNILKKPIFTGAGVALVTPFDENGNVNYRKLEELIEFQIENNTDALIVCGTTGESATLNDNEHLSIINHAVKCSAKRIPVIAGTGSNDTSHAVKMSNEAEKAGADGLLIVTPYYNKTSQNGLIEHYKFISERVSAPIIVYNVPSRTGVNIKPETYSEIASLNNISGAKEANGDISSIIKTMSLCPDDFYIYSGNDDQTTAICSIGGKGVISVLSNIKPSETHELAVSAINGELEKSISLQKKLLPLCNALFSDVNPIPVKEAMNMLNMNVGKCRLPLCDIKKDSKKILESVFV